VAGLKKLVEEGRIKPDERTVVYVTGNGLKAQNTLIKHTRMPQAIKPTFSEFEKQYEQLVVT
jgi:threonine synthase